MYKFERLESQIRFQVSQIIQTKLRDSRIGFISITKVELNSDMSVVKVYYSQIGSEKQKAETQKGLDSAKSFIKKHLGQNLKTRSVPNIHFKYDPSLEFKSTTQSE